MASTQPPSRNFLPLVRRDTRRKWLMYSVFSFLVRAIFVTTVSAEYSSFIFVGFEGLFVGSCIVMGAFICWLTQLSSLLASAAKGSFDSATAETAMGMPAIVTPVARTSAPAATLSRAVKANGAAMTATTGNTLVSD